MRRFLTSVFLCVAGIVLIAFLVANRTPVTISFDPTSLSDPAISLRVPLWTAPAGGLLVGYLLGAMGMWMSNSGLRRRASRRKQEVRELQREVDLANDVPVKHTPSGARLPALRS